MWLSVSSALSRLWPDLPREAIVIENGVDLSRFRFEPVPDDPRYALWCGRILPEKGLHLAIDAARSAGVTLKISGPIIDQDYWTEKIAPALNDKVASRVN